jgi:hypothetical protein
LKISRGFQPEFQPSASRTVSISLLSPSDKSLGYFHSVRFADKQDSLFWAKLERTHPARGSWVSLPALQQ